MEKIKTNEGKIFEVTFHVEGDQTMNTINPQGTKVRTKYSYMVYAVNEQHARQIVASYDPSAEIIEAVEQFDAISQHYGE